MDDRVVIALFRHGLTEENKRKAYLGWNDSPLCPEAKDRLPIREYDGYFTSNLQRCRSTAKILFPNSCPFPLAELREMNFGEWDGKTYDDLKEDGLYQKWLSDPVNYCPPAGESYLQFIKRVQVGWSKITKAILTHHFQSCAVITHGGVIRYLLSAFAPEQKDFWSWQTPHEQGFELIFDIEAIRRGARCTLLREVPLTAKELG